MFNQDYSESDISFWFDYLLCSFEKDLARHGTKHWDHKDLVRFLSNTMWIEEIIGQRHQWLWLLSLPDREYCPRITVFASCITEYFEQYPEQDRNIVLLSRPLTAMQEIVFHFAATLLTQDYRRIKSDRTYQAKERGKVIAKKLQQLSARKSRLLPFRFELYYLKAYEDAMSSLDLRTHLEQFVKEIHKPEHYVLTEQDRDKVDLEILFYARVVEQGKECGHFHIHFMVILDGKHLQTPYRFYQGATNIWHRVTEGHGYLAVQNKEKIRYPIQQHINGQVIDRADTRRMNILFNYVAPYLTKIGIDSEHQYLRIKPRGFEAYACSHSKHNKVK